MPRNNEDFLSAAGFNPEEQKNAVTRATQQANETRGKQIGEQLFRGVEGIMGDYQSAVRAEAHDRIKDSGYPAWEVHEDDEGHHVIHKHGDWTGKWYGGDYMDLYHKSKPDMAADVIHVGATYEPNKAYKNQQDLENWVNENGEDTLNWLKDY